MLLARVAVGYRYTCIYMYLRFRLYIHTLKKLLSLSILILHLPGFGFLEIICPKQMNYLCFAVSILNASFASCMYHILVLAFA